MTNHRPVVWLLRSGDEPDRYEEALSDSGFEPRTIAVLDFERVNASELRRALEHPNKYSGIVFTSPRAVEAFAEAMSWLPSENVAWHTKSIFVVGPRTAAELRAIGFEPEGEQSGSARMLADYILNRKPRRPLLFLCGERRRDELPRRLQGGGVPVEEICVYRSRSKPNLEVHALPKPDWLVFFSPSGIEAAQRGFGFGMADVRIAAIGTTTGSALESAGYRVDAVAAEPSPAGVAAAIVAAVGG